MALPEPFVSIIIPTYNRAKLLPLTLDSMLAQDYPADCFEIIVGNNNSTDTTATVLEDYAMRDQRIRPFYEARQGVHYVRNRAAHIAQGEILYYTDDDMIADPSLLRCLVKAFDRPDLGTATGKVLPCWETPPPAWVLRVMLNGLLSLHNLGEEEVFSLTDLGVYSCHQAIRREVFFAAGGYNPENTAGIWIGNGETGLNIKIQSLGLSFGYIPSSVTYHIIPPSRLTQEYLNNRLANQGNCDAYTEYRRNRYRSSQLVWRMFCYLANPRSGVLGSVLKIPWHLLIRHNTDKVRLDFASLFYNWSRLKYDGKLMCNPEWRALVLRDNWLTGENETP